MSKGTFDAAFSDASQIKGWFSRGELRVIFESACAIPEDRCIVEIGSYAGRSTVVLAHSGRRVYAVDPLIPGTAPTGTWEVTHEHVASLERVCSEHPNVTWVRATSTECPEPAEPVGFLLIDGDHDWPHPLLDYEHFEPWLAANATVAFHDYKVCAGVTRAVTELSVSPREARRIEKLKKRERLFVARKLAAR